MTEVSVCVSLTQEQQDRLRHGVGGCKIRFCDVAAACDSPVVFGNPDVGVVTANRNLRWLQLESVGFGEYAALDWSRPGGTTIVSNLAGFFADPVAETALAGILALYRGIDQLGDLRRRAEWVGDAIRAELRRLTGANVVLFGRGAINARLGQLLAPFGCAVATFGSDWVAADLEAALATADIVVATVPDTPATRGLFDAVRIGRMKPGAVLCNLGRGSLIEEAALAAALQSGHLSGAVIDVTRDEPLPAGHPFWTTPNTILTQHSGGGTCDEVDRKITTFLSNLTRFQAGEPPLGQIDFTKGY
ncbi:MAG: NAD(P)-dependent oxidoreductase [Albidovulum sp.]